MVTFNVPTKIIIGNNSLGNIVEETLIYGKRVYIVTGKKSSNETGILQRIIDVYNKADIYFEIYSNVSTNPEISKISDAIERFKTNNYDLILTLGGGSVHDFGKAISIGATHDGKLADYTILGKKSVGGIKNSLVPVICIPTISGTGAEISPASLIRNDMKKEIIYSPYLYPKTAIIDPSIMLYAPIDLSIKIAIDAFVQGLESYVANNSSEFSQLFSFSAMRRSIVNLPLLYNGVDTYDVREQIALASIESLLGVSLSGVGAIHALSDPLSGRYNIHHGTALAILMPLVSKTNYKGNEKKYNNIIDAFGDKKYSYDADGIYNLLYNFTKQIALNNLKIEINTFDNSDLCTIVKESFNPDMSTNPKNLSENEVKEIFTNILHIEKLI